MVAWFDLKNTVSIGQKRSEKDLAIEADLVVTMCALLELRFDADVACVLFANTAASLHNNVMVGTRTNKRTEQVEQRMRPQSGKQHACRT